MMNFLKQYSITILSAVIFITLVLMILPDNSMKKYVRFLLGLILISVFITPIYGLFNKNIDVFSYQSKLDYYFEKPSKSYKDYENENIESTGKAFKENLNKLILEKLQAEYSGYKFTVNTDIIINSDNKFMISKVSINYKSNKIKKVEKVGKEKKTLSEDDKKIIDFISSEFNIDKNLINVKEE